MSIDDTLVMILAGGEGKRLHPLIEVLLRVLIRNQESPGQESLKYLLPFVLFAF